MLTIILAQTLDNICTGCADQLCKNDIELTGVGILTLQLGDCSLDMCLGFGKFQRRDVAHSGLGHINELGCGILKIPLAKIMYLPRDILISLLNESTDYAGDHSSIRKYCIHVQNG